MKSLLKTKISHYFFNENQKDLLISYLNMYRTVESNILEYKFIGDIILEHCVKLQDFNSSAEFILNTH